MGTRTESDSLSEVEVPEDAYYGAFTARADENFSITGDGAPSAFIRALGQIKQAAAHVNREMGQLDREKADAISEAAGEVADGAFDDAFVLDVIQAGAGTPFHMNANEVIANRATELLGGEKGEYRVHPNDDVNMGQSSNNVIPTAIRLTCLDLADELLAELDALADAFDEQAEQYDDAVKVGRTHLQDAVPITVGQEFDAYATLCRNARRRIERALDELHVIGFGGTAIGTGINTPDGFRDALARELSDITGHHLKPADDHIAMTQSMAPFASFSGAVATASRDLVKIADDLMLLASGPKAGLHELELPEVEPGSSIMPGKVNPSIVEAFKMSCLQVQGNEQVVSTAAQEGDLELNVMTPVILKNLVEMLTVLTNATAMLRERCITGMTVDEDRVQELFEQSTAKATALSPHIGYDTTAGLVKESLETDQSVEAIVRERGLLEDDTLERVLDPEELTQPGTAEQEESLTEKVVRIWHRITANEA